MGTTAARRPSGLRPTVARFAACFVPALLLLASCAQPGAPGTAYASYGVTSERSVVLAVNFDFDSYRIRPESYAVLDNTAVAMGDPRFDGYSFEVNGHTDVTGRFGYNVSLSRLRAMAVVDYLVARGVPPGRLRPQGFGPLQPFDASRPRSGVNRRVEVVAVR